MATLGDLTLRILEIQGRLLHDLVQYLGEEGALAALENRDPRVSIDPRRLIEIIEQSIVPSDSPPPFEEIEAIVHRIGLPPAIEDHLWDHPLYRAFIQGPLPLSSQLRAWTPGQAESFCNEATELTREWVISLQLASNDRSQLLNHTRQAGIRLRSEVFHLLNLKTITLQRSSP